MQSKDLKPAKEFAIQFGVKAVVYGAPGSAKTPLINTAPRPVLLATEPGLLSMKGSEVPTWEAYTAERIDEFFLWLFNSPETKNFDTICVDSISQVAEIYLQKALKTNKHGLQAYGEMARETMKQLRGLYYTRYKHTYLIAKESNVDGYKKPYFDGKQLPVEVPHLYDEILHLGIHNVPSTGQVRSFQCVGTMDILARDRTGSLSEFEFPDFGKLVAKAMA